jgi:hypothetical protein
MSWSGFQPGRRSSTGRGHDSVFQAGAQGYVECTWVLLGRSSPKRDEIQWESLCYANPCATSRMEETSNPWSYSKVDCPYRQCSPIWRNWSRICEWLPRWGKLRTYHIHQIWRSQASISSVTWSKLYQVSYFPVSRNFFQDLEQLWMTLKTHIDCSFFESEWKSLLNILTSAVSARNSLPEILKQHPV